LVLAGALYAIFAAYQAQAAQCADRTKVISLLAEKHGETVVSRGLTADGKALEILVNPETYSWTAVVTDTAGLACGVASGKAWHQPRVPKNPGDPV